MRKRELDRNDSVAIATRKRNVEKRQKAIVEAVRAKDENLVSRLQIGRMRSLDCRVLAVIAVTSSNGGKTPGLDGEIWSTDDEKIQAIEWLGEVINKPKDYKSL